jgi:hypothetical protein
MTPRKTITLKDGMTHVKEEKAPEEMGDIMERLKKLDDVVFRYGKAIEQGLDAHSLMNHDLEKKIKSYEDRNKDQEDKFLWCNNDLERM